MTSSTSKGSPLETLEETAGEDAVGAFSVLGNETRLAILVTLWEAYEPHVQLDAVTFSELRDRIGYDDPGNFQYHLNQLTGTFIDYTEEGYRLRDVGLKIVQTVIAGTTREVSFDTTEIDIDCMFCGGSTAIMYDDGRLFHICLECSGASVSGDPHPDGMIKGQLIPPTVLHGRRAEEIHATSIFRFHQLIVMKAGGLCPRCANKIDASITVCDNHRPSETGVCSECERQRSARVRWACSICKYWGGTSIISVARYHPAVVAFLYDHGVHSGPGMNDFEVIKKNRERMRKILSEQRIRSSDPLRIEVEFRADDDRISLIVNEDLNIEDVQRQKG